MRYVGLVAMMLAVTLAGCSSGGEQGDAWVSLFDGKTFDGWKVNENPATFTIQDGAIVAKGPRSHLFYVGPVGKAAFRNFELKIDVMTAPGSNGGLFFHTQWLDRGWPAAGYEMQVDNTHLDPQRTGGLYNVVKVLEAPAKDNVWFTEHLIVRGRQVIVNVDGKQVVDYTEPAGAESKLNGGTIALQGHDPGSVVKYKNIRIKLLPD